MLCLLFDHTSVKLRLVARHRLHTVTIGKGISVTHDYDYCSNHVIRCVKDGQCQHELRQSQQQSDRVELGRLEREG